MGSDFYQFLIIAYLFTLLSTPLGRQAQHTRVYTIDYRNHLMQMLFLPYNFLNRYEKETCILDPDKLCNEFSNLK